MEAQNELRKRYLQVLCDDDVRKWMIGKDEMELVDLLVRVKDELVGNCKIIFFYKIEVRFVLIFIFYRKCQIKTIHHHKNHHQRGIIMVYLHPSSVKS